MTLNDLTFKWFRIYTPIQVMSPLLIIFRVAHGREDETITRLEDTLAFHHTVTQDSFMSHYGGGEIPQTSADPQRNDSPLQITVAASQPHGIVEGKP